MARGYRRAALSALVPLAIGVAIAFAVYSQEDGNVSGRTTFGALSTAPTLADEDASASATVAAATSSAAAATVLPPATTAPVAMAASAAAQMEAATDAASVAPPVPSVVNRYPADAVDLLRARGFRIRFASAPRIDRADPGTNGYAVVGQDPAAGTLAAPGSTVTLRLLLSLNGGGPRTSEPGPVRVPDVVGLDANAALRRLGGVGLLATLRGSTTPLSSLAIAVQDVRPGTVVAGRTVITLAFGR